MLVYVDDILTFADLRESIDKGVNYFKHAFTLRVQTTIGKFLGFRVEDDEKYIKLNNAPATDRMLVTFRMNDCKISGTPLPSGVDLSDDDAREPSDENTYRRLIGSLLHLSNTVRPHIAYAAGCLSRFMHKPTERLWKTAKYVHRYLKETESLGRRSILMTVEGCKCTVIQTENRNDQIESQSVILFFVFRRSDCMAIQTAVCGCSELKGGRICCASDVCARCFMDEEE